MSTKVMTENELRERLDHALTYRHRSVPHSALLDRVMEQLRPLLDERDTLRTLLAHPSARDLLEHHRHLDSGECSCQAYHAYGPASMDRDEWIAHVVDDARTRGIV